VIFFLQKLIAFSGYNSAHEYCLGVQCVVFAKGYILYNLFPGWTVHADIRLDIHLDIRLDIRKITDVRVELYFQPRISAVNFALWYS